MESTAKMIIINQLPIDMSEEELPSIFNEYGIIDNIDWCIGRCEKTARITFKDANSAGKVWEASQDELIKFDDDVLAITLASESYSPIQNLPDTCLQEIFSRLDSVEDKFRVEMVCKRWKENGRSTWSNFRAIGENKFTINTWRVILERVRTLEHIYLHLSPVNDEEILGAVSESCRELKSSEISLDPTWGPAYDGLDRLKRFLMQNEELRRLKFFSTQRIRKRAFRELLEALPSEVRELYFTLNYQPIRLTNLSQLRSLRVIAFDGVEIREEEAAGNLVTLEKLSLRFCTVPDPVLSQILRNNRGLKHLEIVDDDFSQDVFMDVLQLENLQVLVISVKGFDYLHLVNIKSKLKGFCCQGASGEGIINFLGSASDLRKLGFDSTTVSEIVIEKAREWTERTGKSLEVCLIGEDQYEKCRRLIDVETDKLSFSWDDDDYLFWGSDLIE